MNAISPPVQSILDLFTTDLADVRFADVDAQTLARIAADVEAAAVHVAEAQAALDGARAALQERQDTLLQHAQRALAYARVYAESDAVLSERLDAIALPRHAIARRARGGEAAEALVLSAEPQAAPRRRGRPRKEDDARAVDAEPMLEAVTSAAE
jgi:hypothetical protein